jgi:hypothetical protein
MMKRLLAAVLFILSRRLDRASKWCVQKSMSLLGFNLTAVPPPAPPVEIAGGCLDCGSMFAVKAEFDAHVCPKRPS